eukprot:scaffold119635_cov21-Prasinocladus_malaysianus.AAC.1
MVVRVQDTRMLYHEWYSYTGTTPVLLLLIADIRLRAGCWILCGPDRTRSATRILVRRLTPPLPYYRTHGIRFRTAVHLVLLCIQFVRYGMLMSSRCSAAKNEYSYEYDRYR